MHLAAAAAAATLRGTMHVSTAMVLGNRNCWYARHARTLVTALSVAKRQIGKSTKNLVKRFEIVHSTATPSGSQSGIEYRIYIS